MIVGWSQENDKICKICLASIFTSKHAVHASQELKLERALAPRSAIALLYISDITGKLCRVQLILRHEQM